jgi:tetratricopeptide (TPR) repeat protein
MESILRQFLRDGGFQEEVDDDLSAAQDLVDQAYQTDDWEERLDLATEAIDICPDCADAFLVLAELAPSGREAAEMYQFAVEAGERALGGPAGMHELAGHFWSVIETRPYMRARLGLAQALWSAGQREEAMQHCQGLLQLNPNDNQGVRYVLASYYCDTSRDDELARLLEQFADDASAEWAFSRALLAFRRDGDTPGARALLTQAHAANPHVAQYLLGHEQLPADLPEYVELGGETEAISYASQYLSGWRASSGAITWARRTLAVPLPEAPAPRRSSWAFLRGSVSELPLAEGEVWQADLRRTKIKGVEQRDVPWTFVVTSPEHNALLTLTPVPGPKPKPDELLLQLLEVMRNPEDQEGRRPEGVQVRQKTWWRAWKPKLEGLGVQCELCDELDHVDQVLNVLQHQVHRERLTAEDVAARAEELADLPQHLGDVWQADVRKMAMWITDTGSPQRPWCVLVTSREEDLIVHQDLRVEGGSPAWLRQAVLAGMLAPLASEPHRPGSVEVATEEYRAELAPHLEPLGIQCVVCETLDHVDAVFLEMDRRLGEPQQVTALVDTPGVTEQHVAGFFAAAAEYYEQAPWRLVPGDMTIEVRCDKLQTHTWYVVVMGQSGMTLGLAMYEDRAVLQAILREEEDANRRHAGLSVMYSEAFEIAIRDLDAAEKRGWPVAGPEAYPMILRVNPGMAVRPPLAWELELTEGCLRAIPEFIKRRERTPTRMTVPVASGELTLDLAWADETA